MGIANESDTGELHSGVTGGKVEMEGTGNMFCQIALRLLPRELSRCASWTIPGTSEFPPATTTTYAN
jgi:hypothetical protein